ncbi:MAG: RNA ligase (ATP) [Proteobacteria bacterium]|nr:RNA ligase (ATP) [Pseudomonadota bacterium]NBP12830.1 RNA ligase (ATP) [bacterium]
MKLASLEVIKSIKEHPNADALEIAQVLGWQTIVKKGEFKEGDKIVFIVIDTILPKAPWSEFLADKKDPEKPIRLRTIKLRGQYSQGLVLPLSVLDGNTFAASSWQIGADVGAELGVKKYEKELPASLSGEIAGAFPAYIVSQTDEDNGLSNPDLVAEVLKHSITVTKKYDGSSCTIVVENGEITHVCSRRLSLKESTSNAFWQVARKLTIPEGWSGVIQGECMGPGIQGNQLKLMEPTLYVYQIRTEAGYMTHHNMEQFCQQNLNCRYVPVVGFGNTTLENLISLADKQTLDYEIDEKGVPAEGIVVRPADYRASGIGRPLGFKIINRNFKDL